MTGRIYHADVKDVNIKEAYSEYDIRSNTWIN